MSRRHLNLADPRLQRGRVSWFPLEDGLGNLGRTGGSVPTSSSYDFRGQPRGLYYGTAPTSTGLSAEQLGITGAAQRTLFWEYYHGDTSNNGGLWGCGAGSTRQDWGFWKNGYTIGRVNTFDADVDMTGFGFGDQIARCVAVYAGGTVVNAYWSRFKLSTGNADPVGRWLAPQSASGTQGGTLNTPSSSFWFGRGGGYNPGAIADGVSRMHYLGVVGGHAWTAEEAQAFLRAPSDLWTEQFPIIIGRRSAGVASITGAASGTIDFTGNASGTVAVAGVASGSIAFTGTSAGTVAVTGTASGSLALTGAATGTAGVVGVASGSLGLTGAATGTVAIAGAASGSLAFTGAAAGTVLVAGVAAGSLAFTGAATGTVSDLGLILGVASGTITLTGTAAGKVRTAANAASARPANTGAAARAASGRAAARTAATPASAR